MAKSHNKKKNKSKLSEADIGKVSGGSLYLYEGPADENSNSDDNTKGNNSGN